MWLFSIVTNLILTFLMKSRNDKVPTVVVVACGCDQEKNASTILLHPPPKLLCPPPSHPPQKKVPNQDCMTGYGPYFDFRTPVPLLPVSVPTHSPSHPPKSYAHTHTTGM